MKTRKKCRVVDKIHFVVFECVYTTQIHIIMWTHNYTHKCRNTHNTILIAGLDTNLFLMLGTSQENLTSIL